MKDFLSEYGFTILGVIVIIMLIAFCTPIGHVVKNSFLSTTDKTAGAFDNKMKKYEKEELISQVRVGNILKIDGHKYEVLSIDESGNAELIALD